MMKCGRRICIDSISVCVLCRNIAISMKCLQPEIAPTAVEFVILECGQVATHTPSMRSMNENFEVH